MTLRSAEDADRAVALLFHERDGLFDADGAERFRFLIAREENQMVTALEPFYDRGTMVADYLQYTRHNYLALRDLAQLDKTSLDDLRERADRVLRRDRSHIAVITPRGGDGDRATRVTVDAAIKPFHVAASNSHPDPAEARRPLPLDPAAGAPTVKVRDLTLDNGLRVLLVSNLAYPVIDARLVFPVGSASDPAGHPGVAELTARLLDHDFSRPYDKGDDFSKIEWGLQRGTLLDASVDEQTTTFRARGVAQYADWHLWRLHWLLDQGKEDEEALDRFKVELRQLGDDLGDDRQGAIDTFLYGPKHPYAQSADAGALLRVEAGELESFRATHYRAAGATLIVTGSFDGAAIEREIRTLFGAWSGERGAAPPAMPRPQPGAGPDFGVVPDDSVVPPRVTIAFAPRSDARKDAAARLVLKALIDERVAAVRVQLGASYGLYASYSGGVAGSGLTIDGYLAPRRAGQALQTLLEVVAGLRGGADALAEDFVLARRRVLGEVLADTVDSAAVADDLERAVRRGESLHAADALPAQVAALTVDDLVALIGLDLDRHRMLVLLEGPAGLCDAAFRVADTVPHSVE
jgi:zinc protease